MHVIFTHLSVVREEEEEEEEGRLLRNYHFRRLWRRRVLVVVVAAVCAIFIILSTTKQVAVTRRKAGKFGRKSSRPFSEEGFFHVWSDLNKMAVHSFASAMLLFHPSGYRAALLSDEERGALIDSSVFTARARSLGVTATCHFVWSRYIQVVDTWIPFFYAGNAILGAIVIIIVIATSSVDFLWRDATFCRRGHALPRNTCSKICERSVPLLIYTQPLFHRNFNIFWFVGSELQVSIAFKALLCMYCVLW